MIKWGSIRLEAWPPELSYFARQLTTWTFAWRQGAFRLPACQAGAVPRDRQQLSIIFVSVFIVIWSSGPASVLLAPGHHALWRPLPVGRDRSCVPALPAWDRVAAPSACRAVPMRYKNEILLMVCDMYTIILLNFSVWDGCFAKQLPLSLTTLSLLHITKNFMWHCMRQPMRPLTCSNVPALRRWCNSVRKSLQSVVVWICDHYCGTSG